MTATTAKGTVVRDPAGVRLEFRRSYDVTLNELWSAVTDPDRLGRWFGRWSGDPATGAVQLVPTEGGAPQAVTIDACDPKRRLAVTVPTEDGFWPLEVTLAHTLAQREERVELLFAHRLAEPYDAGSIGPGWQFYLDMLAAEITDTSFGGAWEDYYPALRDAYAVPAP